MIDLILAIAASATPPSTTGVMVTSLGRPAAAACYESAEAKSRSEEDIADCNVALAGPLTRYDLVATHVNRGVIRLLRNEIAEAHSDFDAALAVDSRQPEAWLNKGIALYQQGQPAKALEMFERSIALRTSHRALAHYARGLAHEDTGNLKAAYADLRQALAYAPNWQAPQAELARYQVRNR